MVESTDGRVIGPKVHICKRVCHAAIHTAVKAQCFSYEADFSTWLMPYMLAGTMLSMVPQRALQTHSRAHWIRRNGFCQ